MHVLLDEETYLTDARSIGEAIAAAAAEAGTKGRVVVEVIVDGVSWAEHQLGSSTLCAGTAGEVRLASAELADLVCSTLADAGAALADADVMQCEAAELLQGDGRPEAMEKLGSAFAIWQSVHEAVVRAAEALELDLATLRIGETPFAAIMQRLQTQLQTLHGALSGDDPVELADTLLYEMPDIVAEWREALETIRSHASGEPPPADHGAEQP